MGDKSFWYRRLVKCKQHPGISYPALWRLAFGDGKKVSCGEKCEILGHTSEFLCYYYAAPGDVIKSLCIYKDDELVCPFPHLSYEACLQSVRMVWRKTVGRFAHLRHRKDYHNELCAYVYVQALSEKSAPQKPFFEWLDGHLKNGWKAIEKESSINEKDEKYVDKDGVPYVRQYQIFSLTITGDSKSINYINQAKKAIKRRLASIKTRWAQLPADSAEDAGLAEKIKKLEMELESLKLVYDTQSDADHEELGLEILPHIEQRPDRLYITKELATNVAECISALAKSEPRLYKIAKATQDPEVRTRKKSDNQMRGSDDHSDEDPEEQFVVPDIARLTSLPEHIVNRDLPKAESRLKECLRKKYSRGVDHDRQI